MGKPDPEKPVLVELRSLGMTYLDISARLGVDQRHLRYIISKNGWKEELMTIKKKATGNRYPIGNRIGKNTVIDYIPSDKQRQAKWVLKCDCGSEPRSVFRGTIAHMDSQSGCACCSERAQKQDVIGEQYGLWLVLGQAKQVKYARSWSARRVKVKCLGCSKTYTRQLYSIQGKGSGSSCCSKCKSKFQKGHFDHLLKLS